MQHHWSDHTLWPVLNQQCYLALVVWGFDFSVLEAELRKLWKLRQVFSDLTWFGDISEDVSAAFQLRLVNLQCTYAQNT
jgi:hypothetical protein